MRNFIGKLHIGLFAATLAACGGESPPTQGVTDTGQIDVLSDGSSELDGSDTTDGSATPDVPSFDVEVDDDDAADADSSDSADGSDGGEIELTPCTADVECLSGECVFLPGSPPTGVCADLCGDDQDCEAGFSCDLVTNSGGDLQRVCFPTDYCLDSDGDEHGVGPGCLGVDCDESDDQRYRGASEFCDGVDNDCDNTVDESPVDDGGRCETGFQGACALGIVTCESSVLRCVPDVTPTEEVCDGEDNDCNGVIDDALETTRVWYRDADGDEFGNVLEVVTACAQPVGYVSVSGDCNDADFAIRPGADEVCDGVDNDCDSRVDVDPVRGTTYFRDMDDDGFGAESAIYCSPPDGWVAEGDDCDDSSADVSPDQTEVCNLIDDNCDGVIDEALATDARIWFRDDDADRFGDPGTATPSCVSPGPTWTLEAGDCSPADATEFPGALERCDGRDNDCDGTVDNGAETLVYPDADGDRVGALAGAITVCPIPAGYVVVTGDCNDTDATVAPGVPEVCDGRDQDCDAEVDEGVLTVFFADADGDGFGDTSTPVLACSVQPGFVATGGDCDDTNRDVRPGRDEACNVLDDDCDGLVDEDAGPTWYVDADSDGQGDAAGSVRACSAPAGTVENAFDCDDRNGDRYVGNVEVCDLFDNDCDDLIDEGTTLAAFVDDDRDGFGDPGRAVTVCAIGDGFSAVGTDCNDTSRAISPAGTEVCDDLDNDCNGLVDDGVGPLFYADMDGDDYGSTESVQACRAPVGFASATGDCDDFDANAYPGALEIVGDGVDQSCDGREACWADTDGDSYHAGVQVVGVDFFCNASGLLSEFGLPGDCNDSAADVNPGALELVADGIDQDCNGEELCYVDADRDRYRSADEATVASASIACATPGIALASLPGGDCDDTLAARNPGAREVAADGVDSNCDSIELCFVDADADGYRPDTTSTVESFGLTCDGFGEATGGVPSGDCNDADAAIRPGEDEIAGDGVDQNCDRREMCFLDSDNDGFRPDETSTLASADLDCDDAREATNVEPTGDCADTIAAVNPAATETPANGRDDNCDTIELCFVDADGDRYRPDATSTVESVNLLCTDAGEATGTIPATDCDDTDPLRNPGRSEITGDGIDQNCDTRETCFLDADDDGYRPSPTATQASTDADCDDAREALSFEPAGDCNDASAAVNPGATEVCNGVDDNCQNGITDEGREILFIDSDGDTYGTGTSSSQCPGPTYASRGGDCADTNSQINPGAIEVCNGVDDNCTAGITDEGRQNLFRDADNDTYGTGTASSQCPGPGLSSVGGDCNDNDNRINPGATEVCDGVDNNCTNGTNDEGRQSLFRDADNDTYGTGTASSQCPGSGYASRGGDCNDSNDNVNPGETETVGNGRDDNCDGGEICFQDNDNDGYRTTSTRTSSDADCSDSTEALSTEPLDCGADNDSRTYPGAPEIADFVDNDCDGQLDEGNRVEVFFRRRITAGSNNDFCMASASSGSVGCIGGASSDNSVTWQTAFGSVYMYNNASADDDEIWMTSSDAGYSSCVSSADRDNFLCLRSGQILVRLRECVNPTTTTHWYNSFGSAELAGLTSPWVCNNTAYFVDTGSFTPDVGGDMPIVHSTNSSLSDRVYYREGSPPTTSFTGYGAPSRAFYAFSTLR